MKEEKKGLGAGEVSGSLVLTFLILAVSGWGEKGTDILSLPWCESILLDCGWLLPNCVAIEITL